MGKFNKKSLITKSIFALSIVAIGGGMIYKSGMDKAGAATDNETMFQGFEWNIASNGTHWEELAQKADELSELGVTSMWLPPAFKATGTNDTGYGVYDIYDLGEFNQKGSVRTKYGTKDQYLSLIDTLHTNNIDVYADIVLNHKSSADATEIVDAIEVDSYDRNSEVSEVQQIEAWTAFNFEGRNNTYSSFKWNATHFDGVDWDQASSKNAVYKFAGKDWEDDVSAENGNYDYLMSADIDFDNEEVVDELNTWAEWYVETADLDGFRLDAVKHISASFYKNWLKNIRKTDSSLYSVAEYYDYDVNNLKQYLADTGYSTSVFDFPLQGHFHAASKGDYDLRNLYKDTLTKAKPKYSIAFVENHDTQASQCSNIVETWFKGQAYTATLTRKDGIPCVFYGDYYGTNDGSNPSMADELNVLMSVRKLAAYGKQRDYFSTEDVIGWTREGDKTHNYYGLAAVISDGEAGSIEMNVGKIHKNEVWVDVTCNCSETITISNKGTATFPVNEKSYSVWVSQDTADAINTIIESVAEKSKVELPEDNTVTLFYNTSWSNAYFHYQIGAGNWTDVPGAKMSNTNLEDYKIFNIDLGTEQYLTGCFNDGNNSWDSNNGSNYRMKAGTYTISNGAINTGEPAGYDPNAEIVEDDVTEDTTTEDDNVVEEKDSMLTLIYYTTWENAYAHYCVGSGSWTEVPGDVMTATDKAGYYSIEIPVNSTENVTICFNDGNGTWDSNNGSNYVVGAGSYIISNGSVTEGTIEDIQ